MRKFEFEFEIKLIRYFLYLNIFWMLLFYKYTMQ